MTPTQLRKSIRQQRRNLSPETQTKHAQQACLNLKESGLLKKVKRVAVFLSQDGELDTTPLIKWLWTLPDIELYLPALETQPDWHMGFSKYQPDTELLPNRFNIPEPNVPTNQHLTGEEMDLVIVPLVAFDKNGNRMGMGGGYYDRTFAFKLNAGEHKRTTTLIGWAHQLQQVAHLESEAWDVPLEFTVTEQALHKYG